jgi:transposase
MIQVEEKETIRRLYFIKRHSVRRIARENHYSRKTVKKAITDGSVPEYHLKAAKPSPVMGPYVDQVLEWLEADKSQPKKQRHTAHRIYDRLTGECGFTGAERTVRQHVSKFRLRLGEMAIPLEFDAGADAQCDWGEAQVVINGERLSAQVLYMKLSYSGRAFVMAFPTQRQEAFFEGQRRAFEWYEGIPGRVSYDNLTVAVRKVLRGRNREEQKAFIGFRSHYLFESHFATPAHPQEQGRVESLVGYTRRNYFVPVPEAASFEELNGMLLQRLVEDDQRPAVGKDKTIGEAWTEEKSSLLPLPRFPYRCCVSRPVQANRLSLVTFDSHRYSVPVEYGFSRLTLHAYAWRIEVACGDRVIASHGRRYGKAPDAIEVEHYLPLLIRRPGAFPYAKPVRQMGAVYQEFYRVLSRSRDGDGVSEFLQVLSLGRRYGSEALEDAMRRALTDNRADIERVRQLMIVSAGANENSPSVGYLEQARVILPDLSQFERLRIPVMAGGEHHGE